MGNSMMGEKERSLLDLARGACFFVSCGRHYVE